MVCTLCIIDINSSPISPARTAAGESPAEVFVKTCSSHHCECLGQALAFRCLETLLRARDELRSQPRLPRLLRQRCSTPGSSARSLPTTTLGASLLTPMLRHPPAGRPKPLSCQPPPAFGYWLLWILQEISRVLCQVDLDVIFEGFASPAGREALKAQLSSLEDKALEHCVSARGPVLGGL